MFYDKDISQLTKRILQIRRIAGTIKLETNKNVNYSPYCSIFDRNISLQKVPKIPTAAKFSLLESRFISYSTKKRKNPK